MRVVDPDGREIDVADLNDEEKKIFNDKIEEFKETKRFAEIWNELSTSKAIYRITMNTNKATSYSHNDSKKLSGGTINISQNQGIGHEVFHAYQHNNMDMNKSTGLEIEAILFEESMSMELGKISISGFTDDDFGKSYSDLFERFNQKSWENAINSFKDSNLNINDRYKNYNTTIYDPILIKKMYPLWRD